MAKIDCGGTAFPIPGTEYSAAEYGMSLRDWFAGQAVMGIGAAFIPKHAMPTAEEIAKGAYAIADAMIAQGKIKNDT
jgi:hypothetical protein